jgi:hypothetical protein
LVMQEFFKLLFLHYIIPLKCLKIQTSYSTVSIQAAL